MDEEQAHKTLWRNRLQALKLVQQTGLRNVRAMLDDAQRDLSKRLKEAEKLRGVGEDTFTMAQMRSALMQVTLLMREMIPSFRGMLLGAGQDATEQAVEHTVAYLVKADRAFRGTGMQPLALDEASMFDRATSGVRSSILRRIASSGEPGATPEDALRPHPAKMGILQRYGVETIGAFEKTLRKGLIAKKSWADIRDDITEDSPFLQQAPKYWAERIVRTECLVGETPVSGGMIRAVFRRRYQGSVTEVVTERGRHFTATPNHPMLTTRGWVAAGSLHQGDDLVGYRGKKDASPPTHEDVARGPATLREIFDACAAVGITERRRTTHPDFHGDGIEGEVEIARPYRMLPVGTIALLRKPFVEDVFSPADKASFLFCTMCGHLLVGSEAKCLCCGACDHVRNLQPFLYPSTVQAIRTGKFLDAFSALVPFSKVWYGNDLGSWMAKFDEPITGSPAPGPHGSGSTDDVFDALWIQTKFFGDALAAQPGKVEVDRVSHCFVREFDGHVYNLDTVNGYYTVDGLYAANCMGAYNRAAWQANRDADEQLGDMTKILSGIFDNRTGADSYASHGQIRRPEEPFETWYGPMQHPPDRPNDRAVVVPHRISWPIPPYLQWKDESEVLEAWLRDGRKGKPPDRPLMTTVDLSLFGTQQPPRLKPKEETEEDDDALQERTRGEER